MDNGFANIFNTFASQTKINNNVSEAVNMAMQLDNARKMNAYREAALQNSRDVLSETIRHNKQTEKNSSTVDFGKIFDIHNKLQTGKNEHSKKINSAREITELENIKNMDPETYEKIMAPEYEKTLTITPTSTIIKNAQNNNSEVVPTILNDTLKTLIPAMKTAIGDVSAMKDAGVFKSLGDTTKTILRGILGSSVSDDELEKASKPQLLKFLADSGINPNNLNTLSVTALLDNPAALESFLKSNASRNHLAKILGTNNPEELENATSDLVRYASNFIQNVKYSLGSQAEALGEGKQLGIMKLLNLAGIVGGEISGKTLAISNRNLKIAGYNKKKAEYERNYGTFDRNSANEEYEFQNQLDQVSNMIKGGAGSTGADSTRSPRQNQIGTDGRSYQTEVEKIRGETQGISQENEQIAGLGGTGFENSQTEQGKIIQNRVIAKQSTDAVYQEIQKAIPLPEYNVNQKATLLPKDRIQENSISSGFGLMNKVFEQIGENNLLLAESRIAEQKSMQEDIDKAGGNTKVALALLAQLPRNIAINGVKAGQYIAEKFGAEKGGTVDEMLQFGVDYLQNSKELTEFQTKHPYISMGVGAIGAGTLISALLTIGGFGAAIASSVGSVGASLGLAAGTIEALTVGAQLGAGASVVSFLAHDAQRKQDIGFGKFLSGAIKEAATDGALNFVFGYGGSKLFNYIGIKFGLKEDPNVKAARDAGKTYYKNRATAEAADALRKDVVRDYYENVTDVASLEKSFAEKEFTKQNFALTSEKNILETQNKISDGQRELRELGQEDIKKFNAEIELKNKETEKRNLEAKKKQEEYDIETENQVKAKAKEIQEEHSKLYKQQDLDEEAKLEKSRKIEERASALKSEYFSSIESQFKAQRESKFSELGEKFTSEKNELKTQLKSRSDELDELNKELKIVETNNEKNNEKTQKKILSLIKQKTSEIKNQNSKKDFEIILDKDLSTLQTIQTSTLKNLNDKQMAIPKFELKHKDVLSTQISAKESAIIDKLIKLSPADTTEIEEQQPTKQKKGKKPKDNFKDNAFSIFVKTMRVKAAKENRNLTFGELIDIYRKGNSLYSSNKSLYEEFVSELNAQIRTILDPITNGEFTEANEKYQNLIAAQRALGAKSYTQDKTAPVQLTKNQLIAANVLDIIKKGSAPELINLGIAGENTGLILEYLLDDIMHETDPRKQLEKIVEFKAQFNNQDLFKPETGQYIKELGEKLNLNNPKHVSFIKANRHLFPQTPVQKYGLEKRLNDMETGIIGKQKTLDAMDSFVKKLDHDVNLEDFHEQILAGKEVEELEALFTPEVIGLLTELEKSNIEKNNAIIAIQNKIGSTRNKIEEINSNLNLVGGKIDTLKMYQNIVKDTLEDGHTINIERFSSTEDMERHINALIEEDRAAYLNAEEEREFYEMLKKEERGKEISEATAKQVEALRRQRLAERPTYEPMPLEEIKTPKYGDIGFFERATGKTAGEWQSEAKFRELELESLSRTLQNMENKQSSEAKLLEAELNKIANEIREKSPYTDPEKFSEKMAQDLIDDYNGKLRRNDNSIYAQNYMVNAAIYNPFKLMIKFVLKLMRGKIDKEAVTETLRRALNEAGIPIKIYKDAKVLSSIPDVVRTSYALLVKWQQYMLYAMMANSRDSDRERKERNRQALEEKYRSFMKK